MQEITEKQHRLSFKRQTSQNQNIYHYNFTVFTFIYLSFTVKKVEKKKDKSGWTDILVEAKMFSILKWKRRLFLSDSSFLCKKITTRPTLQNTSTL